MSQPRGYGLNGKSLYTNVTVPQYTWVNFTVTPTNGLGVTSVKSNGFVNYLFMHTSTTPSAQAGVTNPNPADGYAIFSLTNSFNKFLGVRGTVVAPATSTSTTATTANNVYVITALGSASTAQWQAVGLPQGITPAVGQAFSATASATIGGSATVGTPGVSNVGAISIVGEPNSQVSNSNIAQNGGAQIVLMFQDFAGALVAPTAGSIVRLELCYDRSTVSLDGI